ncbi:hypothetical protein AB0E75_17365 [Streptomyces griseoviridis]|uniref:Secreted protein n=3 Tax=Streptomyces TaxID=1883 RepID=A0A918GRT5_STRGD|nr:MULTISPECIES: hypothetical protein [Streptomyces]MDP9684809.1 hypothetical protein [Streptomyces griseoviridis]GGS53017.1 hypothetical protein GCM10010238_48170 [Streptomyces niveoruber]GGT19389.1 hypothetical protein GCM10010240_60450 [Streptomyces griseoviridis]GGU47161.1 hypothetical protein GCM10010259_42830 [Streptomyces daghestanicus]GHI30232.1 hypothetical protein Sdagh_19620 [Streptomyces daghestanicus]
MTHRGRHRRRRRGRALRATLAGAALALTAAATMISASQAKVTDGPGGLKQLTAAADTARLDLTERQVPRRWLGRLSASMGGTVGVGTVLASADHALRPSDDCTDAERESLPKEPAAARAYCWDRADTGGWSPGAVTTSADADDDGRWGDDRVILSAWSREDPATGRLLARVSFVDAGAAAPDGSGHPAYTSALLVLPVDGGRDYRALASPVTGMVWYQDKLLVTAGPKDRNALYVYDLHRIQRATADGDAVGRVPGGWAAHGHPYVLPAVASYRASAAPGAARPEVLSLDRSTAPDSLVAGESVRAGADRVSRLWRYPFSTDPGRAGLPATDAAGRTGVREAYATRARGIRGVLAHREPGTTRSQWYLGGTVGTAEGRGTLWRADTGGARATECGADRSQYCWSAEAGSLSYAPDTAEVWSQSDRALFAVPLAAVRDALG